MKGSNNQKNKPRRPWRKRPVHLRENEQCRLLFGPYETPIPKRGFLVDEVRGKLPFSHYSNALIPWPKASKRGKGGSGGFILCGDLLRALKMESAPANDAKWVCPSWTQSLLERRRTRHPRHGTLLATVKASYE